MENDDRFKHLASDPKFKVLKRKERKVQIDERFKSMFTDKKFTSSADDLRRFYDLKDEPKKIHDENDEESENEEAGQILGEDTDESDDQSLSESSDESESDVEVDTDFDDINGDRVQFNWQPLDHDAETAESASHRLAIQNLDWDKIDVRDLFTLIKSIRMPLNVRIYISEFGKDRLAKEEVEGPQEIIEMPKIDEDDEEFRDLREKMKSIKNVGPKTYKVNEYEDADEIADLKNEELRERIRRYQLNRMKYYYAIAEFDSVESAELVYKELDGLEYEGSSIELDLRFVPDDIEFDSSDMKAECDQVPDLSSYKAPMFINSALQQTTVNFTWDQTDVKRQEKLHRALTKADIDKEDLDAYIGSGSDSDTIGDEVDLDDGTRKDKYKELLQELDTEYGQKKVVDLDVEWGDDDDNGDSENESSNDAFSNQETCDQETSDAETNENTRHPDESYDSDVNNIEENNPDPTKMIHDTDDDREIQDELDLLMVDSKIKNQDDDFKFDPDDERFKAIYETPTFNIDPSHPNFKRNKAFDLIAEKKRKKRLKIHN